MLQGVLDVEVFALFDASTCTGRGGVCVFRMLQMVLDMEFFLRFLNAANGTRRGGFCFFLMLQHVLGQEVFAFFECCKVI